MRSQSPRHFLRVEATRCASEQLPVLELGCGLFGCFVRERCLRLEYYYVYSTLYQQGHRCSEPMFKGTGDKQNSVLKLWRRKRNIKSLTVLDCIIFAPWKSLDAVHYSKEDEMEEGSVVANLVLIWASTLFCV